MCWPKDKEKGENNFGEKKGRKEFSEKGESLTVPKKTTEKQNRSLWERGRCDGGIQYEKHGALCGDAGRVEILY